MLKAAWQILFAATLVMAASVTHAATCNDPSGFPAWIEDVKREAQHCAAIIHQPERHQPHAGDQRPDDQVLEAVSHPGGSPVPDAGFEVRSTRSRSTSQCWFSRPPRYRTGVSDNAAQRLPGIGVGAPSDGPVCAAVTSHPWLVETEIAIGR